MLAWLCVIGALELLQESSVLGGLLDVWFVLRLQLAMHGFALADSLSIPILTCLARSAAFRYVGLALGCPHYQILDVWLSSDPFADHPNQPAKI